MTRSNVNRRIADPVFARIGGHENGLGRQEAEPPEVRLDLILRDLAVVERRLARLKKLTAKKKDPGEVAELELLGRVQGALEEEVPLIGQGLTDNGYIHFYGSDFGYGEDAERFIQRLADISGADISVSDDLTDASFLGGTIKMDLSVR